MNHLAFLQKAAKQGKLSHAYLLSGNDQAGQNALVRNFLFFLMGYQEHQVHGDVAFVRAERGTISIGQVRKLQEHLAMSPWQSLWKIGIMEGADLMNQQAQSALLKLLEEPKGNVLLFLLCEHPALLLGTIRSRAQELRMYTFPGKTPKGAADLIKLQASSFAARFQQAKVQSEDEEQTVLTLRELLGQARTQLISCLTRKNQDEISRYRRAVGVLQEVLRTLRETEGNARFALERAFLAL